MKRFASVVCAAALGLAVVAACGDDSEPPASQPAGQVGLGTATVDDLGTVVVDGNDRTVYVFDKDTADPPKSTCDGDCAMKWPPVLAGSGAPQLDGVDASLVGTVTRTDGSKQLTLAGWPLYLFASDTEAGEVKGQAVGGVWWVVGPDGKKITKQPAGPGDGY